MYQEKINLQQARDFGETFNTSVKFVRQNFKLFFQSLFLLAGPFVLLSSIAGAYYQANAMRMYTPFKMMDPASILNQFGWPYVIFMLATVLSTMVMMGTVFSFMINYQEKGPGNFTINDIGRTLLQNIVNILVIFLVVFLITVVLFALIVAIIVGIASVVPVLGILLAIFTVLGMLVVGPPILWQLSVVYLVAMKEQKGALGSLGKTRDVLKGDFWWTWVIVVCASIAVGIIGFVFTIPQAAFQMFLMFSHLKGESTDTSVAFLIVATVCTFFASLLHSLLQVINGIHYYSLAEKKDGQGLMERINEIGNTPKNNVNQQY